MDIMTGDRVQKLIKNLLTAKPNPAADPELGDCVRTSKPVGASNLRLVVKSPIDIHAYDSMGRHTGLASGQSLPSVLPILEKRIPGSTMEYIDGHPYVTLNTNDRYRIDIQGWGVGTFTLIIEEYLDDTMVGRKSYVDIPVSRMTRGAMSLQHVAESEDLAIDTNNDGHVDFLATSSESPQPIASLQIFISTLNDVGLSRGLLSSLRAKLGEALSALQRGNRSAATGALGAFSNEVRAQQGKAINNDIASGLMAIADRIAASI
jgi:hypothetical protein